MERRRMLQGLALCLVLCVAGCATYTPRVVGIPETAGPGVSTRVQEHLTLSVEAYASAEKSKSVFDTDLADKGIIPLLVTVQNAGQEPYQVHSTDFVLRDGDTVLQMLSPEEASRKAKRDAVGRAVGWSLIVPIIGIPIAATSSVLHTNKVNKSIVQDFTAKAFKDGGLKLHEKRSGFLFFALPKGQKALNVPRLDLTATNLATHDQVTLTTSLPAAGFAAKNEESAAPPAQ